MKEELPIEIELLKQENRRELKTALTDFCMDLGLKKDDATIVQELFFALRFKKKPSELEAITLKLKSKTYENEVPSREDTVGFRVMIQRCHKYYQAGRWKTAAKTLLENYPFFTINTKEELKQVLDNYKNV